MRSVTSRIGRALHAARVATVVAGAASLAAGCAARSDDPVAAGHAAFRANRMEAADSAWTIALDARPGDAGLRAWRAEALRRMHRYDEAVREARAARGGAPGFAHTVLAACYDPVNSGWAEAGRDSCLAHLEAALDADPRECDAWLSIWKYAIADGDSAREREALRRVEAAGYFTPAALAYGAWQLAELPERAVLVTNGDMDTYPTVVLQGVRGVRPDVSVVNAALLGWTAYAARIPGRTGLALPPAVAAAVAEDRNAVEGPGGPEPISTAVLRDWRERAAAGSLGRPLAFAVTVHEAALGDPRDPGYRLCGPWWIVAGPGGDEAALRERFRRSVFGIEPEAFAGPFVSDADRSPVRRVTTPRLGHNLIAATWHWGEAALDAGDTEGARMAAARIEALARRLDAAPDVSEHLQLLRSGTR